MKTLTWNSILQHLSGDFKEKKNKQTNTTQLCKAVCKTDKHKYDWKIIFKWKPREKQEQNDIDKSKIICSCHEANSNQKVIRR